MNTQRKISRAAISYVLIPTLLYWVWESQAEGNIRIDLLLLYPLLYMIYSFALWSRFHWYAFLLSMLLMLINLVYATLSYDLFDKYPG